MADWFRTHFLQPVHDVTQRVEHKFEDVGGFIVKRAWQAGQQIAQSFEAAGSTVVHKASTPIVGAVTAVDKGVHQGLQRVEGAASAVLQKVENAGTNVIHNLEHTTAALAKRTYNGFIHPAIHAVEQPIENAVHAVEHAAANAFHGAQHAVGNLTHAVAQPFKIMLYGGMLIGGIWAWRMIEDQREASAAKRRRYR